MSKMSNSNRWLLLLATSLVLVLAGCAEDGVIGDSAGGGAPPGGDTFATIQSDVLAGCGCHVNSGPAAFNGFVSFQAKTDVVNVASQNCAAFGNGLIVDTGGGSAVSTLHEVASGGGGCPSVGGGMTVGASGAQRIADWIDAGAP